MNIILKIIAYYKVLEPYIAKIKFKRLTTLFTKIRKAMTKKHDEHHSDESAGQPNEKKHFDNAYAVGALKRSTTVLDQLRVTLNLRPEDEISKMIDEHKEFLKTVK